jgi:vesicle-fusing ATPase
MRLTDLVRVRPDTILGSDFKLEDFGIGGLDEEFRNIFRRTFASRLFPLDLIKELGIRHVRG